MKYLETHPYGDDLVAILLIGQVFYNEFNAQRRWDMVNYDVNFPFMMVNRAVGSVRGGGRIIKQLNTPNTTVIAVLTSGIPPDEPNENWLQDKIFGVGNMIATWIYFILLLGSMAFQVVVMKLQFKAKMPWWHPMSSFLNFFYATCTMLQNGPFGPWSLHVWNYIMVSWLVCIPLGTTWATSMAMAYEWIVVILPRTDYTKYIKLALAIFVLCYTLGIEIMWLYCQNVFWMSGAQATTMLGLINTSNDIANYTIVPLYCATAIFFIIRIALAGRKSAAIAGVAKKLFKYVVLQIVGLIVCWFFWNWFVALQVFGPEFGLLTKKHQVWDPDMVIAMHCHLTPLKTLFQTLSEGSFFYTIASNASKGS